MLLYGCLSSTMKEVEADKLRLTPQYLELKFIEAIANNTKIYFGNKVNINSLYYSFPLEFPFLAVYKFLIQVPNMVLEQRLLGSFLQDVVKRENLDS